MLGKIISIVIMLVGAMLVYGSKLIASKVKLSEDNEKNIMAIKITGFIIVIAAAIVIFVRF